MFVQQTMPADMEQVVRQLERGIEEELTGYQEPGNGMHICWQNFKPIMFLREEKVSPQLVATCKERGLPPSIPHHRHSRASQSAAGPLGGLQKFLKCASC